VSYSTGHLPDPPDVVSRRAGLHILEAKHAGLKAARAAVLPLATHNDDSRGFDVQNQDRVGACVGFATAQWITLTLEIMGQQTPFRSPIAPYTLGRMLGGMGKLLPDGTRTPITDDGTEPGLADAAVREWGIPSAEEWGNLPTDPNTINDPPTEAQLEIASTVKLDGSYFIQSTGTQLLRDLMTTLAAGLPVRHSIPASGPTFQGYSGGVLSSVEGPIDHETLIVDYSWDGSNLDSLVFRCLNQWSQYWGEAGFYRAAPPMIYQCADFAACRPRRV
jgi:hypothetical protein